MHIPWTETASLIFFLQHISQISAKSTYPLHHPIQIARADTSLSLSSPASPASSLPPIHVLRRQLSDPKTETTCEALLLNLAGLASSPTGMSVCYSIPSLNKTSGEFTSIINLYQVSPAMGNWTTIQSDSLNVNIAWRSVEILESSPARRSISISGSVVAGAELGKRVNDPVLVMHRTFKGRVMNNWDASDENKQKLALSPIITVSALPLSSSSSSSSSSSTTQNQNQNQKPTALKSILPTTEAPFATGIFSQSIKPPNNPSLIAPPFVLPGTRFSSQISLVGPLITAIWAFLFAATLGLGTLGRWRWRVAFRRRARVRDWNSVGLTELGTVSRSKGKGKGVMAGYDRKASFW